MTHEQLNTLMSSSIDQAVKVGKSPIHGRGVFAQKRFRKGRYIATFEGRPAAQDGMHVLWILDDQNRKTIGIEGRNVLRFLNHASTPNAEFIGLHLYAVSNIQPGQEITFDYGEDWNDPHLE